MEILKSTTYENYYADVEHYLLHTQVWCTGSIDGDALVTLIGWIREKFQAVTWSVQSGRTVSLKDENGDIVSYHSTVMVSIVCSND
jgi:hypothetical protein